MKIHLSDVARGQLLIIVLVLLMVLSCFCLWYVNRDTKIILPTAGTSIDLINGQNWVYLPSSLVNNGIKVLPNDPLIVELDGSGGQPNPPINLYGTYLRNSGDFEIDFSMDQIKNDCSLALYNQPPVIADEFRVEPASIRLNAYPDKLISEYYSGYKGGDLSKQLPATTKTVNYDSSPTMSGKIISLGKRIIIITDSTTLALTYDNPFMSGNVWLGVSSHSGCTLTNLSALPRGKGHIAVVNAADQPIVATTSGLQAQASKQRPGFLVGAAMALGPLVSDQSYRDEALTNFGSMTPENAMKWQFIEPSRGNFTFAEADALIAIAQKQHISVHGHTLVFSEANPHWVEAMPTSTESQKNAVLQVMNEHITSVVNHFRGKVSSWDVVNEPLADYDNFDAAKGLIYRNNLWYKAMGSGYITKAFSAAHSADPSAKLFINEYGLESNGERWDSFFELVKNLKSSGVPLDGVGFEAHVYDSGDKIDPNVLRQHIDALAAIGIVSRISEMDVYSDDGAATQAEQYQSVFDTCLSDINCESFTTWGVDNSYDEYQDDSKTLLYGKDLLFDHGKATTALNSIKSSID